MNFQPLRTATNTVERTSTSMFHVLAFHSIALCLFIVDGAAHKSAPCLQRIVPEHPEPQLIGSDEIFTMSGLVGTPAAVPTSRVVPYERMVPRFVESGELAKEMESGDSMDISEGGSPPQRQGGCVGNGSSQALELDWLSAGATPDMLAAEARGKTDAELPLLQRHRL